MSLKDFILFAQPWWVNLLILVPLVSFYFWYRRRLVITLRQLLYAALFAAAFGFVEAAVVDYLRGNIPELAPNSGAAPFESTTRAETPVIPPRLLHTEQLRETATMVMLLCVPLLATPRA